jgi:hypothetical protein
MDSCEFCEDSGIVGVGPQGPLVCKCEIGRSAKEANPDWQDAFPKETP